VIAALLLSLMALPALALSEAYGIDTARPLDGGVDVPVNTMPVVQAQGLRLGGPTDDELHELVLVDYSSETKVDASVEDIGAGLYRLVPDEELSANTEYVLMAIPDIYGSSGVTPITRFTTGEEVDEDVPTIPQPIGVQQVSETDEWGDWHSFSVEQRPAVDPVGVVYAVVVESVDCARAGDCGMPPMSYALGGAAAGEPSHDGTTENETLRFFSNPTGESDPLATLQPLDSVVRIFTEDLAGNSAPLVCMVPNGVEADEVGCADAAVAVPIGGGTPEGTDPELPSIPTDNDKFSGCAVAGGAPVMGLSLMAMAAVARRRRDG